jgi:hypothetical protein
MKNLRQSTIINQYQPSLRVLINPVEDHNDSPRDLAFPTKALRIIMTEIRRLDSHGYSHPQSFQGSIFLAKGIGTEDLEMLKHPFCDSF